MVAESLKGGFTMFLAKWLKELKMDEEDIAQILEKDRCYRDRIAPLAKGYMQGGTVSVFRSFTTEECKAEKAVALQWLGKARQFAQSEAEDYMLQLLFWLYCIPYLEEVYRQQGISRDVLVSTMMDLTYKTRECRKKFGYCGVATQRFFLFCRVGIFGLGRLQFNPLTHEKEMYRFGAYTVNPGDRIYGCHIPSSGKLTPDMCWDALDQAYNFFRDSLRGNILPVQCSSWLLYPPYVETVFPEGSNMRTFAQMFDVVSATELEDDLYVKQTVFGSSCGENYDNLPQETALQRNLAAYLRSGGSFGRGYGILLYDGVKKEIVNRRKV